jgi:hypothetical protein
MIAKMNMKDLDGISLTYFPEEIKVAKDLKEQEL